MALYHLTPFLSTTPILLDSHSILLQRFVSLPSSNFCLNQGPAIFQRTLKVISSGKLSLGSHLPQCLLFHGFEALYQWEPQNFSIARPCDGDFWRMEKGTRECLGNFLKLHMLDKYVLI